MNSVVTEWRFIPLLNAPGSLHMAIDEWLLDQHRLGSMPSVLRFYTWSTPTLSLGYHQRRWPDHWNHLTWHGQPIDLVRRPSGGRAVLHDGDLTYAVITSGLSGQRMEVYQTLCQFLIQGWRSLGVPLHYGTGGRGYIQNPNCFGSATAADLVTEHGSKFIGSAQLRRQHAILQHGSMQLQSRSQLYCNIFGQPVEDEIPFTSSQTNHHTILDIINVLTGAAQSCFSMACRTQPLSKAELNEIAHYQNKALTSRT